MLKISVPFLHQNTHAYIYIYIYICWYVANLHISHHHNVTRTAQIPLILSRHPSPSSISSGSYSSLPSMSAQSWSMKDLTGQAIPLYQSVGVHNETLLVISSLTHTHIYICVCVCVPSIIQKSDPSRNIKHDFFYAFSVSATVWMHLIYAKEMHGEKAW